VLTVNSMVRFVPVLYGVNPFGFEQSPFIVRSASHHDGSL
jgi:hypothetical protein